MCLAVPARIISVENKYALAETMGVRQRINVELIDSPMTGDYVLIHAGFAIERVDELRYKFINESLGEMMESNNE